MRRHVLTGVGAAVLLLLVYMGIISLAGGPEHALEQTYRLWYWVTALAVGFGVQVGLFSFIRQGMRQRQAAATTSVTASGGVSAGSMAACCAHHLSDMLPLIGLSGLAAFLTSYQTAFIVAGILSNLVGITIMLESIQRHQLSRRLSDCRWNMRLVKRRAMVSAGLLMALTIFLSFFTEL
ncbi:MAG: hypothetical protein V1780_01600 [Chloroflexota bacterium]